MGVPIIRTIVFWGLYWDALILGNYHIVGLGFWVRGYIGLYRGYLVVYRDCVGVIEGLCRDCIQGTLE